MAIGRRRAREWFAHLLVVVALLAVPASAAAQAKWETLAPFPAPSEELLGAAAGGKLYVFAGLAPGFKPRGYVYEYDPTSNAWTQKKPMAVPTHHVAFAEYNGKIYGFGGFVLPASGPPAWEPVNNAWEYDPKDDSWKALAPMPSKRGAAAAAVVDGKIYVIGGAGLQPGSTDTAIVVPTTPHRALGTVEAYDPATNTWRTRSPMPTARNHLAVATVNGKIYAIGGRTGAVFIRLATNTDVVEEYDPATDHWGLARAKMPTARSSLCSGAYDGRIYVAGGEFQDERMSATFRAVEAYDPARNQWTTMPPMPVSRHGMAGAMIGSRLHLVSGDVQSAGTGLEVSSNSHLALQLETPK